MNEPRPLQDRSAMVTGASSGLGGHFARILAAAGANVGLTARRLQRLEDLAGEIELEGGRALPIRLDVTSSESVSHAFDEIEGTFGTPEIIVNNAGVAFANHALEHSEADWDTVIDTNLKGTFLVSTEAARRLRKQSQGGSIINVASIMGLRQMAGLTPYAVSKAGLIQMTRNMALEFARWNIRVNAISPGYIDTDMNHDYWSTAEGTAMIKRIPQQRLGEARDLDGALLLLASDGSEYMTGSVLVIDGGHLVSTL